jgi:hypothetical protein
VVLTGGVAGVTAVLRLAQPSRPDQAAGCYQSVDPSADIAQLPFGEDPIVACRQIWASGLFADSEPSDIPELVACITSTGGVAVFPGDESTCGSLGLLAADPVPDEYTAAVSRLQRRVVDEINLPPCTTAAATAERARNILAESDLSGWTVEIRSDSLDASCAKGVVIGEQRVLRILRFP